MIESLRAVDFRCFEHIGLEIPAAGAVLTGANAQGKTSVLEAVCLLVRLHSPRTSRLGTVARVGGAGGFGVAGRAWEMERRVRWAPGKPGDYRVEDEERAGRGAYLADGGLLVWMGNEDVELIRGGGAGRRRFLDFVGSQVGAGYRRALTRYSRAVRAKNLLLRDPGSREAEIRSYEEIMIEQGALLTDVRRGLVDELGPAIADYQERIAGRTEDVELEYEMAGGEDLSAALEQERERERRRRLSLVGPHRDDLVLRVNGMKAADFASEGQQRTLALALKLAQGQVLAARRQEAPIWLIDDIFGELDVGRRNAVLAALPTGAQTWVTTTHLDWLRDDGALGELARFHVESGRVEPLSRGD